MNKNKTPERLAIDISQRSPCSVKVGAVIMDEKNRVVSWGWNGVGDGFGTCAEVHAISRASRKRLHGCTIFVYGIRHKSNNPIVSRPCNNCQTILKWSGIKEMRWSNRGQEWIKEDVITPKSM